MLILCVPGTLPAYLAVKLVLTSLRDGMLSYVQLFHIHNGQAF